MISATDLQKITPYNLQALSWDLQRQLINQMLSHDYSEHSIKALRNDVVSFINYYSQNTKEKFHPSRVQNFDIINWKKYLIEQEYKPTTINRRLSSLRTFYKAVREIGLRQDDPTETVKKVSVVSVPSKKLEDIEVMRLKREVYCGGNLQHIAIFELLLSAGLRVSEVCNLRIKDVVFSERKGHAEIRWGKGNKTRQVPLSPQVRQALSKLKLEDRQPDEPLFMSKRGPRSRTSITSSGISKVLQNYGRKANVKVTPHILRHSFSYNYLEQTKDLSGLSCLLGHSDIRTTASVYCAPNLSDLQEKIEKVSI